MSRYIDYKNSATILKQIDTSKKDYLIIHYSCESFYNKTDGYSPRITSIAIRKFDDSQTELFAIHKIAEIENISFNEISEQYDKLEKKMLAKYFHFISTKEDKKWIHWNMRDSNYGFKAIEHRAEVLGIPPSFINDNSKIDLASLFIKRYGKNYADNPRIKNLIKQNNINPKDLLYGHEEAEAFNNKEYIKLGMSTASKVGIFSDFINLAIDNKLKVKTNKFEIYSFTLCGIYSMIKDNTFYSFIFYIVNLIIGALIGGWIGTFFN